MRGDILSVRWARGIHKQLSKHTELPITAQAWLVGLGLVKRITALSYFWAEIQEVTDNLPIHLSTTEYTANFSPAKDFQWVWV